MSVNQQQVPLWQALQDSAHSNQIAFHTPGHKRGRGLPAAILQHFGSALGSADLPELPELDNLFAPEAAILEAQVLAAQLFGAEQTWFLTNGSTCGILAALLTVCGPGAQIIVPRNLHTSVISGLVLSGAVPIFVQPTLDSQLNLAHSLSVQDVQLAFETYPQTKAIFLIHPTYEGVCGDVSAIATFAHDHDIPLIVDEAHGPHFAFHPQFPQSALAAGADLVVQSTHKMLGALTQAAMLHVQGLLIDRKRLSQTLQLVQSTSPNYLLLASLDATRHQLAHAGLNVMEQVLTLANKAHTQLNHLPNYRPWDPIGTTPGCIALDQTRLTIPIEPFGDQAYDLDQTLIDTYRISAELITPDHLTFLITLGNTEDDIDQLLCALRELYHPPLHPSSLAYSTNKLPIALPVLSPREAYWYSSEVVPVLKAVDRISTESICPYPPGIPILLPGERIQKQDLDWLLQLKQQGGIITGCSDLRFQTLKVVRE
ncbi:aminotransferase class I/II-fold pyridoxal phosphate-dependent enzyme [Acaryochloris marina]|uniref:Orn/Lys/Arg decarboxylase n=1 Tax=Acaryochloris marina (strain MBIC 11017) TaxID=329726 RepID=B0C6T7_ACAM1|nr:aminotransferase class I/II-fold pyridoxal phosphate-dependent enzyme [Acaryochloris marina]ABW27641.1 Orn/Lys/Arg decarboxylase [Acaryochloris marina MBIC11017]BDM82376.1 lysine decarboxylase [Acaryochloris marina MBIC10699]